MAFPAPLRRILAGTGRDVAHTGRTVSRPLSRPLRLSTANRVDLPDLDDSYIARQFERSADLFDALHTGRGVAKA